MQGKWPTHCNIFSASLFFLFNSKATEHIILATSDSPSLRLYLLSVVVQIVSFLWFSFFVLLPGCFFLPFSNCTLKLLIWRLLLEYYIHLIVPLNTNNMFCFSLLTLLRVQRNIQGLLPILCWKVTPSGACGTESWSPPCNACAQPFKLSLRMTYFLLGAGSESVGGHSPAVLRAYTWLCVKGWFLVGLGVPYWMSEVEIGANVPRQTHTHYTIALAPGKGLTLSFYLLNFFFSAATDVTFWWQ